jgi:hypothetical protein
MATQTSRGRRRPDGSTERAQPPIRWPRPDRSWLGLFAVWVVGLVVALFIPASIVTPGAKNPPSGDVWLAFSATLVGAAIMIAVSFLFWRRKGDASVLIMGAIPAVATVVGGIILTASKLTGG